MPTPAAPAPSVPGAVQDISANTQAVVQGMGQLKNDGLALQLADLDLQTTVLPVKKLAGAAKDALG